MSKYVENHGIINESVMNSTTIKRKSPPSFSIEHRQKIGAYWKGRSRSIETRLKMSLAQKGKVHSSEARLKNKLAHLGNHHTQEAKEKIGFANKGEKNKFWAGGKMKTYSVSEQIRKSTELRLWKKACMERDKYTCQKTGIRGCKLEVHHIFNFADFPQMRTSIENGITLSKESHKLFHTIYGKKNNNRIQLQEFLNDKTI